MNKSIQYFEEAGIRKLEKVIENFLKSRKDMARFVHEIQNGIIELGLDGHSEYLLDTILGMDPHERMTEDAEAELLKEAADTPPSGMKCTIIWKQPMIWIMWKRFF